MAKTEDPSSGRRFRFGSLRGSLQAMLFGNPRGVAQIPASKIAEVAEAVTRDYFSRRSRATRGRHAAFVLEFRHPWIAGKRVRIPVLWTITDFDMRKYRDSSGMSLWPRLRIPGRWKPDLTEEDFLTELSDATGYPQVVQYAALVRVTGREAPSLFNIIGSRVARWARYDEEQNFARVYRNLDMGDGRRFGTEKGFPKFRRYVQLWLARSKGDPQELVTKTRFRDEIEQVLAHELVHGVDALGGQYVGEAVSGPTYAAAAFEQRARNLELVYWLRAHKRWLSTLDLRTAIDMTLRNFYGQSWKYREEFEHLPDKEKRNKMRLIARFYEQEIAPYTPETLGGGYREEGEV